MYVSPISALLAGGKSTPAIRAISLPLPLFVFRVHADDPHDTLAMDHLAFVANLLDGRSNFHMKTGAETGGPGRSLAPPFPTASALSFPGSDREDLAPPLPD